MRVLGVRHGATQGSEAQGWPNIHRQAMLHGESIYHTRRRTAEGKAGAFTTGVEGAGELNRCAQSAESQQRRGAI